VSGFPPLPKAAARLAEARFAREGGSDLTGPPKGHYGNVWADRAAVV